MRRLCPKGVPLLVPSTYEGKAIFLFQYFIKGTEIHHKLSRIPAKSSVLKRVATF